MYKQPILAYLVNTLPFELFFCSVFSRVRISSDFGQDESDFLLRELQLASHVTRGQRIVAGDHHSLNKKLINLLQQFDPRKSHKMWTENYIK